MLIFDYDELYLLIHLLEFNIKKLEDVGYTSSSYPIQFKLLNKCKEELKQLRNTNV